MFWQACTAQTITFLTKQIYLLLEGDHQNLFIKCENEYHRVPSKLGFIAIQNPNFVFGVLGHPVNFNFLSVLLLVVDAAMQGIF